MSASDYLENKVLDHVLGKTTYTGPATLYYALHTADPTDAGAQNANEATGTAYARVAKTNNTTEFPNASGGVKANGSDVNFPTPGSGGWGLCTHWSVGDAISGAGNILFSAALAVPKTIDQDDTVSFAAGALTYTAT